VVLWSLVGLQMLLVLLAADRASKCVYLSAGCATEW
jgi:hypothetical protein